MYIQANIKYLLKFFIFNIRFIKNFEKASHYNLRTYAVGNLCL
jgi:hypothetical protein